MSLQDTWNEEEESFKKINEAVKAGNTAEALDRMQEFKKQFGKSYSKYKDDQESAYWASTDR